MARNSFSNHFYIVEADANTVPAADEEEEQTAKQFGYVKSKGAWASAVEAVDPLTLEVTSSVQLTDNDSGRLVVNCFFESHDKEYLVVGGGSTKGGALYVFEYSEDGSRISLLHKTPVAEHPTCMIEFQGRLLVALGAKLVFYELGTKQLLRKGEHRFSPTLFSQQLLPLILRARVLLRATSRSHLSTLFTSQPFASSSHLPMMCSNVTSPLP